MIGEGLSTCLASLNYLLMNDEAQVNRGDYFSLIFMLYSEGEREGERNPRWATGWLKAVPVASFVSGWPFFF